MLFDLVETGLFLPPKTGSTSLTWLLVSNGWASVYGPKPWARDELSPHVAGCDVRVIDDRVVRCRGLLFREPVARLVSFYGYGVKMGWVVGSFGEWLLACEVGIDGWAMSQVRYCENFDFLVRCEFMLVDLLARFPGLVGEPGVYNAGSGEKVVPTVGELNLIYRLYRDDFVVFERFYG